MASMCRQKPTSNALSGRFRLEWTKKTASQRLCPGSKLKCPIWTRFLGARPGRVEVNLCAPGTLRNAIDDGLWTEVRRVKYEYYATGDGGGSDGDLKMIAQQLMEDGQWSSGPATFGRPDELPEDFRTLR
jgi:hypothetical protein